MSRPLHLDPAAYREEQRRQHREDKAKRRDEHKAYVATIDSERQAENDARRKERDDAERERVTARLRRRHLIMGGTEESFEARKAELVAEEMQRLAEQAEARTTATTRKRIARAF